MIAKHRKVVVLLAGWTFAVLAMLALFGSLSYDVLFALIFLGYLLILGLTGPFASRPAWRSRMGVLVIIGALIFFAIVLGKIYSIQINMPAQV